MAGGRIKGITVEIGGDTTGLDKALKGVNSTIKTTQSSLKDVNKLLKLDPANTNLVTQKQKLLKDAVNATKEKLEALKTAQEQARQQLENGTLGQDKYDALQREIIETEEEMRRLQQEAETTSSVLSKIDEAGKKFEKAGDAIAGAGRAVMPVSGAVAGLGAAAVKTSADFDSAMSQVAAVSGATGSDFDALRDKAREMGSKTKFSASEAAQAMNYMAMAGWKTEDMLSGIDGIMNLAAASGEDLATTSDIVTDALTAFGLKAGDSGHFADLLAAASSNANTNVSMMGETFKYCAPIAGALGYSAEDTAEAIGLMANSGIKSSQAGTSLRTIMTRLKGELELSGKALGDVTIQTTNADGSMREFSDIIADCRGAFSKMTESEKAAAAETLVGKNAMSGFLALMNVAPGDIEKLEKAISTCSDEVDGYSGAAEKMAAVMQDNLNGQLTILKSQIEELAISFGDALMPAIRKIVTGVQGFIDKLNGMSEGQRNAILRIGLFVAALGPFLVILGTCISKVGVAMQSFVKLAGVFGKLKVAVGSAHGVLGKIGAALGGVSAPVLAVVAVIAVLVAAFLHLWRTNEGFREAIIGTWEKIKSTISTFVEGIKERLSALGFSFSDIAAFIRTVWDGLCQFLGPVFIGAFNAIATQLQMILGVITGIFDIFSGLFTGNWTLVWQGVSEIFSSIWEGMKQITKIEPTANRKMTVKTRVAAYCRVSTGMDEQLISLETQKAHYQELISSNPDWVFAGLYYDEGISGTNKEKRPALQKLIADCEAGKVKRILTKSLSRFARNTTDCLEMVRKLLDLGVTIYFEKENLDTGSMESELMLSIMSSLAESESVSISQNSKWGVRHRFENGTYKISYAPYGYNVSDGVFSINEQEAKWVRWIFSEALSGRSITSIARELNEKQVPSRRSGKWTPTTIRAMLTNEKYIGDCLFQKSFSDFRFHRRKNYGERDQFYMEDHHEAIISREDFEAVGMLIEQRTKEKRIKKGSGNYRKRYPFSKNLICGECGSSFKRHINNTGSISYPVWACVRHLADSKGCSMKSIKETDLERAFTTMMNKLIFAKKEVLEDLLEGIRNETHRANMLRIDEIDARLEKNGERRQTLVTLMTRGYLEPALFTSESNELSSEADALAKEKENLMGIIVGNIQKTEALTELIRFAGHAEPSVDFNDELVERFLEKVTVSSNDEVVFHLKCGLSLTERIDAK